jgi:hypothetical protein
MIINNTSPKEFYERFVKVLFRTFIFCLVFLLISIIATSYSIISSPNTTFTFCFTNKCLETTMTLFSASIKIFQGLLIVVTSVATIGGIFLALKSYINTHSSSILHNHISHLSLFKDFILGELDKRDKLHISSFDIFKWYNLIYKESKSGSMNISNKYVDDINSINIVIESSNQRVSKATNGSFIYNNHQDALISVMLPLGVKMSRLPRNNFYEVETQLLELISVINIEFCSDTDIPELQKRYYI